MVAPLIAVLPFSPANRTLNEGIFQSPLLPGVWWNVNEGCVLGHLKATNISVHLIQNMDVKSRIPAVTLNHEQTWGLMCKPVNQKMGAWVSDGYGVTTLVMDRLLQASFAWGTNIWQRLLTWIFWYMQLNGNLTDLHDLQYRTQSLWASVCLPERGGS